jgi:hypothetical protein
LTAVGPILPPSTQSAQRISEIEKNCAGQQDIGHRMIRFSEGFPAEIGPPIDLHQFNVTLTSTETEKNSAASAGSAVRNRTTPINNT